MRSMHGFIGIVVGTREQVRAAHERVMAAMRPRRSTRFYVREQHAGPMAAMCYRAYSRRGAPAVGQVLAQSEAASLPAGVAVITDHFVDDCGEVAVIAQGKALGGVPYDERDPYFEDCGPLPPMQHFEALRREMGFTEPGPVFES